MSMPTIPEAPSIQQFDKIPLRSMGDDEIFEEASNDFWPRIKPFAEDVQASSVWMAGVMGVMGDAYQQVSTMTETATRKASEAEQSAQAAKEDASRAESALARLPEGTIDDAAIAKDKAWSSKRISDDLNAIREEIDGGKSQEIGQIVYSLQALDETVPDNAYVRTGQTYLQSAYPELFEILGVGEAPPSVDGPVAATARALGSTAWAGDNVLFASTSPASGAPIMYRREGLDLIESSFPLPWAAGDCSGVIVSEAWLLCLTRDEIRIYELDDGIPVSALTPIDVALFPHISNLNIKGISAFENKVLIAYSSTVKLLSWDGAAWSSLDIAGVISSSAATATKSGGFIGFLRTTTSTSTTAIQIMKVDSAGAYNVVFEGSAFQARSISLRKTSNGDVYLLYSNNSNVIAWKYSEANKTFELLGTISTPVSGSPAGIDWYNDDLVLIGKSSSLLSVTRDGDSFSYQATATPAAGQISTCSYNEGDRYLTATVGSERVLKNWQGDFPFDVETEFYVPDVSDLSSNAIGTWLPGARGRAYVRAK